MNSPCLFKPQIAKAGRFKSPVCTFTEILNPKSVRRFYSHECSVQHFYERRSAEMRDYKKTNYVFFFSSQSSFAVYLRTILPTIQIRSLTVLYYYPSPCIVAGHQEHRSNLQGLYPLITPWLRILHHPNSNCFFTSLSITRSTRLAPERLRRNSFLFTDRSSANAHRGISKWYWSFNDFLGIALYSTTPPSLLNGFILHPSPVTSFQSLSPWTFN